MQGLLFCCENIPQELNFVSCFLDQMSQNEFHPKTTHVQSSTSVDEISDASNPVDSNQALPATAPKTSDSQATSRLPDVAGTLDEKAGDAAEEVEEEEEGECGFCLFMKGGGCKETFIAWEKCVEEAEKSKEDVAEKCFEVTGLLKKCMDAHADYYAPILQAEKAMEEEAARELGQATEEKPPSEALEAGR